MTTTTTPTWRKSSHSGSGDQCVELADLGGAVGLRDSKNPNMAHFTLNRNQLGKLLRQARR